MFHIKVNIRRSSLRKLDEIAKRRSSWAYLRGPVLKNNEIYDGFVEYIPNDRYTTAMIINCYKQLITEMEKATFVIVGKTLSIPGTQYQDFKGDV